MAGLLRALPGRVRLAASLVLALSTVSLLTCSAQVEAAPSGHASVAAPLGGVNIGGLYEGATPAMASREIAAAKAVHAGVVRAGISWSVMEPAASGQVSAAAQAFTDRLVSAAAADRIKVILIVDSTPCWASSAPAALARRCSSFKPSAANAWPPSKPADYAAFVAYLAKRYGTQLAALEIWNEPDQSNQLYFAGPHKVQRYAAILRAAYPAIKQANPAVPVIAGSLVGANGVFLRALYAAGIKGYYDGLAVHFYTLGLASLRAFREVQVANADTKPLWLDEFGWTSCYPRHKVQEEQPCVTPGVQGRNLADLIRSLPRAPYVAAQVMYNLQDFGQSKFGVLSASGRHKAAYGPLSQALASPIGRVHPITLALRRRGNSIVASGSGPVGDYLQLEAFAGSVLRYRASFTLDRFNRYSLTLPAVLGTRGLQVRVFQPWAGLQSAAQRGI